MLRIGLKETYNKVPTIAIVLVGNNPASEIYVRNKIKAATFVGMNHQLINLDESITMDELLNEVEVENLVDSIGLIIMECATRFLTDYLDHDVYFKTDYQEQNLDRVINQLTLYERYLNKENLYKEYVRIILNRL